MTDEKKKTKVADIFEDWSRPIGLVLFLIMLYAHVVMEVEFNMFIWGAPIMLIAGEKLAGAIRK